ncbi:MAG: hypothetical protein K2Y37_06735 [Pirellulales bacterium]|nr:hypothetical protein [Pirellulales bacterium]
MDPLWLRILAAAQTTIRALDLAGLPDEAVLVRPVAGDRDIGAGRSHALPVVELSLHEAEREAARRDVNLHHDVDYPVLVTILAAERPDLPENLDRWLAWREAIAAAFRHQRLAGVSEVYDCAVEPGRAVQDATLLRQRLWASTLVLRFVARGQGTLVLKYGGFAHSEGETSVVITSRAHFNPRGLRDATSQRWEITGLLQAATPAELTAAIDDLAAAYALSGQDLGLFLIDGVTPTSHALLSADTLGGTRVVEGPEFLDSRGEEYALYRTYRVVVEGLVPAAGAALDLVLREESITLDGGGPRFVYLQTIAGPPRRQQVAEQTPYRAQQAGRAVGRAAYPAANAPLWPADEHVDRRQIVRRTPRVVATTETTTYTDYEIAWQYEFESAAALLGGPTAP